MPLPFHQCTWSPSEVTQRTGVLSARTGSHVHLQMNSWKKEGDHHDGLSKMLSEWTLIEMSNPPLASNITFRNKQKAYPGLG